jgi:mannitol/fructose-specific phosphotransferase system IIA component (Ntr-type)
MTGSRYLFAMSRDKMLPEPFGRVSGRFSTPYVAISVTGGLVILAVFVDLYILVEAASIGLILANILANLSVIALRESRVQNYRPKFRSPLYPWVQVVGILGFIFLLFEMGVEAFVVSAVLVVAGFCLYWFYGRKRVQKETGLLHLVQRITARELVTGTLEAELKGIIRERDEMPCDRFDRMIESSPVIDVEEPMEAAELFRLVADELSDRLSVDKKELVAALEARERESSTVIGPTLAVPHVVIEKTKAFDILLARSRAGFIFPPDKKGIHAVFVLVGSKDERNFHLQALAAIAQIVQEPGFDEKWLAAREEQSLRDLVVLGERKRNR